MDVDEIVLEDDGRDGCCCDANDEYMFMIRPAIVYDDSPPSTASEARKPT